MYRLSENQFEPGNAPESVRRRKAMKKIIKNSLYNTETARLVGSWDNGIYGNDFRNCSEDLYQTRSGKYFLYGEGGPMSKYAVSYGNNTSGSEKIMDMTAAEAREWAEEKLTADGYQKEFGPVDEASADDKIQTAFNLSASTIDLLKKQKAETGMTMSQMVELAIIEIYKV